MHATRESEATTPGRPPEYDKGLALSSALSVFWRKGYEATSLVDLCEATKMSKSTLYAVFGDKRQLFLSAIQAYSDDLVAELKKEYLASAEPLSFIEGILYSVAREAGPRGERRGCLVMNSATEFAQSDADVARIVSATLDEMAAVFAEALRKSRPGGKRTSGVVEATALHLVSTIAGMKTMVKAGRSQEELERVADVAIKQVRPAILL